MEIFGPGFGFFNFAQDVDIEFVDLEGFGDNLAAIFFDVFLHDVNCATKVLKIGVTTAKEDEFFVLNIMAF